MSGVARLLAAVFIVAGAFGDRPLTQSDGEPPNEAGADLIAARMAPMAARELGRIDPRRAYCGRAPEGDFPGF